MKSIFIRKKSLSNSNKKQEKKPQYAFCKTTLSYIFLVFFCFQLSAQNDTRQYLTGNWGGARDSLNSSGITINPRITFFNQNFVAGSGDKETVWNGKAQLDFKANGKKIGLANWTLVTKGEYNFGNALSGAGYVLIPKNTAITFPGFNSGDRFDISSLYLVWKWKPGNQVLMGKINMVDLAAGTKYSGGAGLDAFWSLGFAAPVSGITPPYLFGSIANISGEKLKWTFMVYDPVSAVGNSGLESPFSEGVVLSVSPSWNVKIGNHKGSHSVRFAYSSQNGDNLYNLGDITPPVDVPLSEKNNRFYGSYSFNHPIQVFDDKRSWGVWGQFSVSDGNPNPIDYSFLLGLGGNSFLKNRSQDKWGIALYNYSLSSILDDIGENMDTPLCNELGIEAFYQYWANNWFSIGGNAQIVNPILKSADTAIFLGLRSSIKL